MPVLVTGAEDALGSLVVDRVRASGGEVRVYLDATAVGQPDADRFRTAGCKVALGELDDEGHLEAALAQTHTVAHCWGGALRDRDDQVVAAATVASAALGAGARRLIWVRELAEDADNVFLRALAEIDDLFDALPMETVTLATGLRHGQHDALTARLARGWLTGTGADLTTVHAPVGLTDVAHAVVLADRQRGAPREVHVRMALVGPERMTLGAFLRRLRTARAGASDGDDVSGGAADAPPPPWLVDWLSTPAAEPAQRGPQTATPVVARGTERLPGVVPS